jgi:hypothetical protein
MMRGHKIYTPYQTLGYSGEHTKENGMGGKRGVANMSEIKKILLWRTLTKNTTSKA